MIDSPLLQAERSVIGAIFCEPAAFQQLSLSLRASDFSQPQHIALWTAFGNLRDLGDPIDAVTVSAHLSAAGKLNLVGGPSYLAELEGSVPTTANVGAYAKIVREAAERRAIFEVARGLAGDAKNTLLAPGDVAASATAALDRLEREAAVSQQFVFQPGRSLLDEPETKPLWLVNGLLPEAGVAVIAGEPKAVKTWAAIEMAMALATATPAFGRYEARTRRRVALFMAEDSKRSVRTRIRVLAGTRNMSPGDAADWMSIKCRGELDLLSAREVRYLIESCREIPNLGLLTLDPLRDLHAGDENDSGAMSAVFRALRSIRDELGCAVLIVHHASKQSKDTADRRPGQRMRGSSAVHGAVDAGLYLTDTDTDLKSRWTSKLNAEIKEGAGIGKVKLTLRLENTDGVAQSGSWEVETSDEERKERDDKRAQAEEAKKERAEAAHQALVVKIVQVLTEEPQASRTIRSMVRASSRAVDEALETAKCKGLAKSIWDGNRCRGWAVNFAPAAGKNGAQKTLQLAIPEGATPTRTEAHSTAAPVSLGVSAPLHPPLGTGGVRACITPISEDPFPGTPTPAQKPVRLLPAEHAVGADPFDAPPEPAPPAAPTVPVANLQSIQDNTQTQDNTHVQDLKANAIRAAIASGDDAALAQLTGQPEFVPAEEEDREP